MASTVKTSKVRDRRTLRFETLGDLLAEVDRLEKCREVKRLGNWSVGQNMSHLARTMVASIDGFSAQAPLPFRILGKVMKARILRGPIRAGFQMPRAIQSAVLPPEMTDAEGIAELRAAVARLRAETKRAASPFMGSMSAQDWEHFHCRHAELHLSFLVPVESP